MIYTKIYSVQNASSVLTLLHKPNPPITLPRVEHLSAEVYYSRAEHAFRCRIYFAAENFCAEVYKSRVELAFRCRTSSLCKIFSEWPLANGHNRQLKNGEWPLAIRRKLKPKSANGHANICGHSF